ncbi:hypothetical protein ACLOJK_027732 [Asimina triloba]
MIPGFGAKNNNRAAVCFDFDRLCNTNPCFSPRMADDAAREIEQIETLLLLSAQSPGAASSSSYSSLLHFQERSANVPSAIQALADRSHRVLRLICSGASLDDEEM